jgi:hypothetical protein
VKKRYHADSRPQPQKRRDNIGLSQLAAAMRWLPFSATL